ncbi:MAG: translocation/assembly module TamB domain-containing protein [Pseudomonadota bacterium]
MRRLVAIGVLALMPGLALAQNARLEQLLENQLSNEERIVEIDNFTGALTSVASMDALRISDANGLWIELKDLSLDWNRGALFQRRLEVRELSAAEINFIRPPESEPAPPSAEASGFRIPELPLTIQIDRLAVERILLGAAVLGQEVEARAALSAFLDGGTLELDLDAERTDDQPGRANIALAYDPDGQIIDLSLDVSEPQGGILAQAMAIPEAPALDFEAVGSGPLDDFGADIRLATDGAERLAGRVEIAAIGGGDRAFRADLGGDIRPLLARENRGFFGEETALRAVGERAADGALTLDVLQLSAERLALIGSAALAPGGAPERLSLNGALGGDGPVGLPGSTVTLAGAELALAFDAAQSDVWDLSLNATQVDAGAALIGAAELTGRGLLRPGTATPFDGRITVTAENFELVGEPALSAAIGRDLALETDLSVTDAGLATLSDLEARLATGTVTGSGRVEPVEGRVALAAELRADVPDLAPLSDLAGRALEGRLNTGLALAAELPGGAISLGLDGETEGIDIGIAQLAPIVSPLSQLTLVATRDEAGTRIETFTLDNPELTARVSGSLSEAEGGIAVEARLREIGLFTDLVEGTFEIDVRLDNIPGEQRLNGTIATAFGLDASVQGALGAPEEAVSLRGTLDEIERFVPQLSGVAALTARVDLGGEVPRLDGLFNVEPGIEARVSGPLAGPNQAFDIRASVEDAGAFVAQLPGPARLNARLDLSPEFPEIDARLTATPGIEAEVSGPLTGPDQAFDIDAAIADLGAFVPQLAGPASLSGRVEDVAGTPRIGADIEATPGLSLRLAGRPLPGPENRPTEITARLVAENLGFVAPQLAGRATADVTLRDIAGAQAITASIESATGLTLSAQGALSAPGNLTVNARAAALSRFVDGLSGGATARADISDLRGSPNIRADITTDQGAQATITGEVGLPGGAVSISANGTAPLGIAEAFVTGSAVGGTAAFDLALNGQPGPAALSGRITTSDARFFAPNLALTLSPVEAAIDISGGNASIDADIFLEGSPIALSGTAGLLAPNPVDISITTRRLPVRFQDILENETSLDLTLRGNANNLSIAGNVEIEDTEIRIPDSGLGGAPDIPAIRHVGAPRGVAQTLARAGLSLSGGRAGQGGGGGGPVIPLDITVTATSPIFVRGRGVDAGFEGAVSVQGTAREPIAVGELGLTRGRLDFLGRRLDLSEGRITLAGALIPSIDIVARTTVEEITAEIGLRGPVTTPELVLTSAPPLPEDEILSRVLFGRGIETLSAFQVARLINSVRRLSGAGGDGILEDARSRLNVDNFDVRTNAETGETEVTVGQTINEGLYSEVEVGSGGTTTLNLNLDLNQNTTLRGSASSDGQTGIGIFWERDY